MASPQPPPSPCLPVPSDRLHDVIHCDKRLYLVFEYLDLDLKKLMDASPAFSSGQRLIKVRPCAALQHKLPPSLPGCCVLINFAVYFVLTNRQLTL